jgi:iron complex outermembrane receptor protein
MPSTLNIGAPALLAASALMVPAASAADHEDMRTRPGVESLKDLSIEELAQIPVRSASKQNEPLSSAPTAIYVITDEDIARAGATSLPEVLREASNLQVQRIDAREYAITARGFNGYDTANKLLVQIDGRSIYSTLHSGVFWELHNPVLEDIRQIEVISGPGGTLYGTNAVNGVISVTTQDASETMGLLARATAGTEERTGAIRYGFGIGSSAALRVYGTYFDRGGLPAGTYIDYNDGDRGLQGGFRGDVNAGRDHFTLQGDIFRVDTRIIKGDRDWGQNLLGRWTRDLGDASSVQVQAYYDEYRRHYILVSDALQTFDSEAQYNRQVGRHRLVAGVGVRTTRDEFINNLNFFQLSPQRDRLWFFNGFVQDQVALGSGVTLIGGLKLERSSFSGLEVLPNLRLAWLPSSKNLLWAAVSRAVRTPSRVDRDLSGLPILAPAPNFVSEKLVAVEAGYRGQPTSTTTLSLSGYLNFYDDIRSTELTNGGLPVQLRNGLKGRSYGLEFWGTQQLARWWRLKAGVNLIGKDFHAKPGVVDIGAMAALGSDPSYQLQLRSQMDLTDRLSLDLGVRAVAPLHNPRIPSYREAEARIAYRATKEIELFVTGQNLLHSRHLESNDADQGQAVPRMVYVGARLRL